MNDYCLYVLMRTDLQSMTPGRACAQANHAASVFEHECGKVPEVQDWKLQTTQGFGTCIVLAATRKQIDDLLKEVGKWYLSGKVIDPDYVVSVTHEVAEYMKDDRIKFLPDTADENTIAFTRSEMTCAYIFGKKEDLKPWLGDFKLY